MSTINVYGESISVSIEEIDEGDDGEYCPINKAIRLSNRLNDEDLDHTLLHELFHAVMDRLGFSEILKDDVEELIVDNLSQFIIEKYQIKLKDDILSKR